MMHRGDAQVEGYDVFIGGALGAHSAVARRLGHRVAADEVPEALSRLFLEFTQQRLGGEPFSAWANRVSDGALREILVHAVESTGAAA